MKSICEDLRAEYQALDDLVSPLAEERWQEVTAFNDWKIYDQVCHIAFFDEFSLFATEGKEDLQKRGMALMQLMQKYDKLPDVQNEIIGKVMSGPELLDWWRGIRNELLSRLEKLDPKDRLPWVGPDMSAVSFATARLMETWAHGQYVYDQLKVRRKNTDRLNHIAHLGMTTFGWSFANRKQHVPEDGVRVVLTSPSGELWTWGPENAEQRLTGSAEEFCLVVTQCRNVADTSLECTGDVVKQWMEIAQCFAGPPVDGPKPGARVVEYQV